MAKTNPNVANLHDQDGTRRDLALRALGQIEFMFIELKHVAGRLDTGDAPCAAAVILALAVRGQAVTNAAQSALDDVDAAVPFADLEETVSHG